MRSSKRQRRSSIWIALVAIVAVLAMLTPASAAPAYVVAPPGATVASYLPKPYAVLQKGNQLRFVNLDTAPHDVRSTSGIFYSPVIGIGKTASVWGANLLKKGIYSFYCSIHPNMKGKLRVI